MSDLVAAAEMNTTKQSITGQYQRSTNSVSSDHGSGFAAPAVHGGRNSVSPNPQASQAPNRPHLKVVIPSSTRPNAQVVSESVELYLSGPIGDE